MHETERWILAALGDDTIAELARLDEVPVGGLPKAIWGLVGLAVLVLVGVVWLHVHDSEVRKTAELQVVVSAQDDTIATLRANVVALGKAIKSADSAWTVAKGTVTRVAYVPPALRDSILALNRVLDSIGGSGGTTVPIAVAREFRTQLNACTLARDQAVAGAMVEESACDAAKRLRDSTIADLRLISAAQDAKLNAIQKLAGLSRPRLTPFIGAAYSPIRKQFTEQAGISFRLFSGLSLTAVARLRDSLDIQTGAVWTFR